MSLNSLCEIIKVVDDPLAFIFFCIRSFAAEAAAVNPRGNMIYLVRGITAFAANILECAPRKSPDCLTLFNSHFENLTITGTGVTGFIRRYV